MAGGAKSKKKRSATEESGTCVRRTTSYHPHTAFPAAAMNEEKAKSSHAGRSLPLWARA